MVRAGAELYVVSKHNNPELARLAKGYGLAKETHIEKVLLAHAKKFGVELAFMSPEAPLEKGLVDLVLSRVQRPLWRSGSYHPNHRHGLIKRNVVFVPNCSFVVYIDIDKVENDFCVPLFGGYSLLRSEERSGEKSYYWLLEKAKLPTRGRLSWRRLMMFVSSPSSFLTPKRGLSVVSSRPQATRSSARRPRGSSGLE